MGVSTSTPSYAYDQLYLPADHFRLCNPSSSCFCHTNHNTPNGHCGHHSRSKYVYVERNNPSGRESYRDPMEWIERGMVPPGWLAGLSGGMGGGMGGMSMWRAKDWEVMRGLVAQMMAEKRELGESPWGDMMGMGGMGGLQGYEMGSMGAYPAGPGYHQQYQYSAPPPYGQWQGPWQGGMAGGGGNGSGRGGMMVDEETRDRTRLMHDIMFGSEAEKQEKQLQEQLLKRLTPMIPELAKLLAMQQAGLNGAGSNGGGMMAGPPPAGGMPAGPMGMGGMSPHGPAGGMPGMNPMMYSPAAMGGMHPMMGGGDPSMLMGGGGDMGGGFGRRRNRGRRAMRDFDYDEDDDDDFVGFGGRGRGGGMRRRRRGRYNFDDDDLFGDRGGEDSRFRGPPPRGPSRPRPNNGGGGGGSTNGGGGGAVFDTFNEDARFRTVPTGDPQPAQWTSPRNTAPAPPPMATAPPPNRILTPVDEPINASPPPMPINRPGPPPGAIPISPDRAAPPYRFFETTRPPTYTGIPVDGYPPTRPIPIRHAHFRPEAGLARPRQDEENRGEPQAGGPANPHYITPQ
ncbi:hypothetical protein Q7P35_000301 [Cladosporium inversicolor]